VGGGCIGRRPSIRSSTAWVRRLAELILPQTDTPGSTEVKVAEFVDLLLAQSLMQKDKAHLLAGLEQIDVQSRAEYGGRFDELKEDEQVALLRSLDAKERRAAEG